MDRWCIFFLSLLDHLFTWAVGACHLHKRSRGKGLSHSDHDGRLAFRSTSLCSRGLVCCQDRKAAGDPQPCCWHVRQLTNQSTEHPRSLVCSRISCIPTPLKAYSWWILWCQRARLASECCRRGDKIEHRDEQDIASSVILLRSSLGTWDVKMKPAVHQGFHLLLSGQSLWRENGPSHHWLHIATGLWQMTTHWQTCPYQNILCADIIFRIQLIWTLAGTFYWKRMLTYTVRLKVRS